MPTWEDRFLTWNTSDLQLDLDHNLLEVIPPFPKVLRLHRISISNNEVQKVQPYAFANLQQLQYLSLSHNKIKKLNQQAFAGHDHEDLPLKELDLSHNFLRTLDNDLFDYLPNLDQLQLHHNTFSDIDASTASALNHLHHLSTLSMAWNQLKTLPEGLVNPLTTLTTLDLTGNNFTNIPPVLQKATNLQYLNLNSNPFVRFTAGDFEGLEKLSVLNISVMAELTAIHQDTFSKNYHLHILWCSYNPKLSYISPEAFPGPDDADKLEKDMQLHFNNNNLTTLAKTMLPWVGVVLLDLQDNPLICDCHTSWIRDLILMRQQPEFTTYLTCASPEEAKGKGLMNVNESVFQQCQVMAPPPANPEASTEDEAPRSSLAISLILGGVLAVGIVATLFIVGYIVRRRRQLAMQPRPRVRYVKARVNEVEAADDIGLA